MKSLSHSVCSHPLEAVFGRLSAPSLGRTHDGARVYPRGADSNGSIHKLRSVCVGVLVKLLFGVYIGNSQIRFLSTTGMLVEHREAVGSLSFDTASGRIKCWSKHPRECIPNLTDGSFNLSAGLEEGNNSMRTFMKRI